MGAHRVARHHNPLPTPDVSGDGRHIACELGVVVPLTVGRRV